MTMFLGYHPDAYWEIKEGEYPPTPDPEEIPLSSPEEVSEPQESPTPTEAGEALKDE
jgi:hypothetical protein